MDLDPELLEIFDFDWTLFRSPHPPSGVARKTFVHSPESLEPPHAPLRPPSEFWIEEVVREMRAAQRRPRSMVVMITARREKTEDRILDLLNQQRLSPEYAFFRATSFQKDKDRVHFKRQKTIWLLEQYPTIRKVVVWEDDPEQIASMKDVAKRKRVNFEGNLVTEPGGIHL